MLNPDDQRGKGGQNGHPSDDIRFLERNNAIGNPFEALFNPLQAPIGFGIALIEQLEPFVEPTQANIDLVEPKVDLVEAFIDFSEPLVDLVEAFTDLSEPLVYLNKAFVNLLEALVDLSKTPVDLGEALVDLLLEAVQPFVSRAPGHRLHASTLQRKLQLFVADTKSFVTIQCRFSDPHQR